MMRATARQRKGRIRRWCGVVARNASSAMSSLTRALTELMLEVIGDYHI